MSDNKAVVLFSGGIDSTTCLALARAQGFTCNTLSFSYGQKHQAELVAAEKIARHYQVAQHQVIELPIGKWGSSALTDASIAVPQHQADQGITTTYVPGRNSVFLALAVSYAESIGAFDVFFGACDADHSGFPDCRPSYIRAFEAAINQGLNLAPGQRMQIHAPLLNLTKQETLNLGVKLGVDYSLTVTCYQATADGLACGVCSSCQIRHQGFLAADLPDVTRYVKN